MRYTIAPSALSRRAASSAARCAGSVSGVEGAPGTRRGAEPSETPLPLAVPIGSQHSGVPSWSEPGPAVGRAVASGGRAVTAVRDRAVTAV